LQITKDRRRQVIDLYFNQHKTYAEIAEIEKMSPRDIYTIIKEDEAREQKYKQQEISVQAYQLFSEGKTPVEVAVVLNLSAPEVTRLYREYWELKRLHTLNSIYKETNGKLGPSLKLYRLMKEKGMSIEQVVNAVDTAIHKLPYMESLYRQIKDQVKKLQYTRQGLVNEIGALELEISILDKTAFSCEQERKRTEQRVQELADKKDRIEKLIANILNGEGCSKLKQVAKESIKVVLSDNKILISASFAALIQTIKNDAEWII
jgi:copper chaperone CopZ